MPRGRRKGSPDTRAEILDAARIEFTRAGYGSATIRSIAQRASVDPALVMHYFESKQGLFVAAIDVPVNPADILAGVFADGAPVGRRLIATMLTIWDSSANRNALVAVLRSATADGPIHDQVLEFLEVAILDSLEAQLDGDDARLRATLAGSQLVGLLTGRYLLELEPIASASVDDLADRVGPVIDAYLEPLVAR